MANIGQEEDFEAARQKALSIGASQVFIEVSDSCQCAHARFYRISERNL